MRFSNVTLKNLFLSAAASGSSAPIEKAIAHNFKWDERLSDQRASSYEQPAYLPLDATWQAFADGYARYFCERMEWDGSKGEVPDAFKPLNDGAALHALPDGRRELVRVVKIDVPLKDAGLRFSDLRNAIEIARLPGGAAAADPSVSAAAHAAIDAFVRMWNSFDHRPPCFVGFELDVRDDLAGIDWPHRLRDRFGLGHLHVPPGGAPISVMLLKYPVDYVLKAARGRGVPDADAVRVPTVLESKLYHFFFPSPTPLPYGRTVFLGGGHDPSNLTCELVHLPVNLRAEHIYKVGQVTQPIPVPEHELARTRNDHLDLVRQETGRDTFGDLM